MVLKPSKKLGLFISVYHATTYSPSCLVISSTAAAAAAAVDTSLPRIVIF